jgi:hypothetical protein
VQLDFDKGAAKATKIGAAADMRRADATKREMKDADCKHASPLVAFKDSGYSDRRYLKAWTDEEGHREKELQPNMKMADHKSKISRMLEAAHPAAFGSCQVICRVF